MQQVLDTNIDLTKPIQITSLVAVLRIRVANVSASSDLTDSAIGCKDFYRKQVFQ